MIYCTAGQLAIGYSAGSHNCYHGFWYSAWITSSVDVAITSFWGEYIEGAVVLHWQAQVDATFDGFNVYRKQGDTAHFVRINNELISPGAEGLYTDCDVIPGNTYLYRIEALQGIDVFSSFDLAVSVPPKALTLYQNFPNPFNPSTSIRCYIPGENFVTLDVFDVSGRRVVTLLDSERCREYVLVNWDGKDSKGNPVSSGVYLYRLTVSKVTLTKKMVLLR
ncbi:MAG TPA: T9SS type A sorting domain-containing protein [Candidatus Krumholzibacterium sp.]|nr:T9SS type A sorting domain-containing protein [Candidatus Krumholzibacterium sp.]